MSDDTKGLRPATAEEIAESLSFGLRFSGRKRIHGADELMSRITAQHLIEHLAQSNYVIMKKPPTPAHSIQCHPDWKDGKPQEPES